MVCRGWHVSIGSTSKAFGQPNAGLLQREVPMLAGSAAPNDRRTAVTQITVRPEARSHGRNATFCHVRGIAMPRTWQNVAFRPWLRASGRTVICVTAVRLSFGAADPASIGTSRCSRPALGCPNAFDVEPMLTCQPRQTKPGWFSHMAGYRVQIDDTTAQSPVAKTKRRNRVAEPSVSDITSRSNGRRGMSTRSAAVTTWPQTAYRPSQPVRAFGLEWPPPPAIPCSCRRQMLKLAGPCEIRTPCYGA